MFHRIVLILLALFPGFMAGAQWVMVENKGQWDERALYRMKLPNGALFLEDHAFTYHLYNQSPIGHGHSKPSALEDPAFASHAYQVNFENTLNPIIETLEARSEYSNYFRGNHEVKWSGKARHFSTIAYRNLYRGIDLLIYSEQNQLKYDFIVAPSANPGEILMTYQGQISLQKFGGEVVIETPFATITEGQPYAYQIIHGEQQKVECHYIKRNNQIYFDIGEYNRDLPLIIDPVLSFSSYIGSFGDNFGSTATGDSKGNLIAAGIVFEIGYPVTLGETHQNFNTQNYCDVGISKFSADGNRLLFSTYFGGEGLEMPHSLTVDSKDHIILMGTTGSPDFPVTSAAFQKQFKGGPTLNLTKLQIESAHMQGSDIFISKFSSDGSSLIASTFMGGSDNDGLNITHWLNYNYGDGFRGEVMVNSLDQIGVATTTSSTDFPISTNAPQKNYGGGSSDGVAFLLSEDLQKLIWGSYIGGISHDAAYSMQVNSKGIMAIAGGTNSTDLAIGSAGYLKTAQGGTDGFIVLVDQTMNQFKASSYVGTDRYNQIYFVQTDLEDNIYVLGQTEGDFPLIGQRYQVAKGGLFIQKYSPDLLHLLWSTTVGKNSGEIEISPTAFLVSDCHKIYYSGWGGIANRLLSNHALYSTTKDLPVTADAFQSTTDGDDFYLAVLADDAKSLEYATFFGGDGSGEHVDGGTSKFDKSGAIYQAVCAGCGGNSDFPTSPNAWSKINPSENCNLGVFKFDLTPIILEIKGPEKICRGEQATLEVSGGKTYTWNHPESLDDVNSATPTISPSKTTTYTVKALNEENCSKEQQFTVAVEQIIPGQVSYEDRWGCAGEPLPVSAAPAEKWHWMPEQFFNDATIQSPDITLFSSQIIKVEMSNICGTGIDSFMVHIQLPDLIMGPSAEVCQGDSVSIYADGNGDIHWEPSALMGYPNRSATLTSPIQSGYLYASITDSIGCQNTDSLYVTVEVKPKVEAAKSVKLEWPDGPVYLEAWTDASTYNWSPVLDLDCADCLHPSVQTEESRWYVIRVENEAGCSNSDSTWVEVFYPLYVPNSFTPNNDGHNDVFNAQGLHVNDYQMQIHNRWGQLIFESRDINLGWNGQIRNNGEPMEAGVYVWTIEYRGFKGKELKVGHVTLVR